MSETDGSLALSSTRDASADLRPDWIDEELDPVCTADFLEYARTLDRSVRDARRQPRAG